MCKLRNNFELEALLSTNFSSESFDQIWLCKVLALDFISGISFHNVSFILVKFRLKLTKSNRLTLDVNVHVCASGCHIDQINNVDFRPWEILVWRYYPDSVDFESVKR